MAQINLKEIKRLSYQPANVHHGYTDHFLHINVGKKEINISCIEDKIKQTFVGGKGYDLWFMWHAVSETTRWNDPENAVCISSGPLGGTPGYPGGGKSIVTAISPLTGAPIDSNVAGISGRSKNLQALMSFNWTERPGRIR